MRMTEINKTATTTANQTNFSGDSPDPRSASHGRWSWRSRSGASGRCRCHWCRWTKAGRSSGSGPGGPSRCLEPERQNRRQLENLFCSFKSQNVKRKETLTLKSETCDGYLPNWKSKITLLRRNITSRKKNVFQEKRQWWSLTFFKQRHEVSRTRKNLELTLRKFYGAGSISFELLNMPIRHAFMRVK